MFHKLMDGATVYVEVNMNLERLGIIQDRILCLRNVSS